MSAPQVAGGRGGVSPARLAWRYLGWVLLPGLSARTDGGEEQDVVRVGGEDRVSVEVVLGREAVEVLRAVRRPAGADHHGDDRELLQEDLLELRRVHLLLLDVERPLPLVQDGRRLRVREVLPVAGWRRVGAGREERVLGEVRVEVGVRRAAWADLPEQRRVLRRERVREPVAPR